MNERSTDPEAERLFLLGDRLSDAGHYREAWRAFLRAARCGHASSQLNLGTMYSDGRGIRRSRSKARHWLLKAMADRGTAAAAANNLGITYLERSFVRRGRRWLELAIALGDDDARLHFGHLVLAVYGDLAQARVQFQRLEDSPLATAAGNESGRSWRAMVESMVASRNVRG